MKKPFAIGLTGGSGSGKTLFIKELATHFSPNELCVISQDHYYKPRASQPTDENGIKNFDLPQCIDREALSNDFLKLKAGINVLKKEYTFNNPKASPTLLAFKSTPILIIEGLFVLYFEEIVKELDLKIFLEASDQIKLERRINRDKEERGYDKNDVIYRYQHHVMPVYQDLIKPLMDNCDVVIMNNKNFQQALSLLVSYLKTLV